MVRVTVEVVDLVWLANELKLAAGEVLQNCRTPQMSAHEFN